MAASRPPKTSTAHGPSVIGEERGYSQSTRGPVADATSMEASDPPYVPHTSGVRSVRVSGELLDRRRLLSRSGSPSPSSVVTWEDQAFRWMMAVSLVLLLGAAVIAAVRWGPMGSAPEPREQEVPSVTP